jgi:hypothetical protein
MKTTKFILLGMLCTFFFACNNNQLSASALNALFSSLPTINEGDEGQIIINGNPGEDTCDKSIAINKGWRFY